MTAANTTAIRADANAIPKFATLTRVSVRFFAVLLALGLLVYLVFRVGPQEVWKQLHAVGWV